MTRSFLTVSVESVFQHADQDLQNSSNTNQQCTVLPRRFSDFKPPQCTRLSPVKRPLTSAAVLFQNILCVTICHFSFSSCCRDGAAHFSR